MVGTSVASSQRGREDVLTSTSWVMWPGRVCRSSASPTPSPSGRATSTTSCRGKAEHRALDPRLQPALTLDPWLSWCCGRRYGGSKLERARDLFEQCLEKLPPQEAPEFYIKVRQTQDLTSTNPDWSSARVLTWSPYDSCWSAAALVCSTPSWRRSSAWPGMPWPSTTGPAR